MSDDCEANIVDHGGKTKYRFNSRAHRTNTANVIAYHIIINITEEITVNHLFIS